MGIPLVFVLVAMLIPSIKSFLIPNIGFLKQRTNRLSSSVGTNLKNFITSIIEDDITANKNGGRVVTRFPPEPNGYLHLGHAKSVNFNFGVARQYNGVTNMRFDDTNPAKEDMEYVNCILDDVKWLNTGQINTPDIPWNGSVRYASDYFPQIYESAEYLINKGLAYVDSLSMEEIREYRGSRIEPGRDSPYRTRSIEENMKLFRSMKIREFPEGHCVLRAKIDMTSPNMNMRDPLLYRIKSEPHPITGNTWCIYPMYDFAHAISDALEGITHSLCTLEFEAHRPLYDWVVDNLMPSGILPYQKEGWRPQQIEFSRLNLQYTVLSKRKLIELVKNNHVNGWDDPRMPTICGLRRRGYSHTALKLFCERVGVTKVDSNFDMLLLEDSARDVLENEAPRVFAVLEPLKITITNWDATEPQILTVDNHPKRPEMGNRQMPFSGSVYIERDDFFDTGVGGVNQPPIGYKRLLPGGQVRLRFAYVITCNEVLRDANGKVTELKCTYDVRSAHGVTPTGTMKVKGVIPWVSEAQAVPATVLLYDRLFVTPLPGKDHPTGDFIADLNPKSLRTISTVKIEPSVLGDTKYGTTYQFERQGYFTVDTTSSADQLKFNRVVTLKDTWADQIAASNEKQLAESNRSTFELEDFNKIELRVGKILSVEKHPSADSLYVTTIDCGDVSGPRQIVCGLVKYYEAEYLTGKKVVVITNLKPAKLRGIVSNGMVLAASMAKDGVETVELLQVPSEAVVGELIGAGKPNTSPAPTSDTKKSNDVWKRVSSLLKTNNECQVEYADRVLMTSVGPCTVSSLVKASVH